MKKVIKSTRVIQGAGAGTAYRFKTFNEVFSKVSKEAHFKQAYNEEITRLRLAQEVRLLRTKKHLTQEVVAQKAGMPQSVVARIERGERSVSVNTLGRIAYALGKEVRLV
ncbi:MAG: helix-turn-helix transcriptional regulator [Candidatus Yonathbacteria bacterium]|nr:helix-turn-helix transcriptional regulator [Candidatus Yonathbacteria bacterium]